MSTKNGLTVGHCVMAVLVYLVGAVWAANIRHSHGVVFSERR
jgi:hypothetical protein